MTICGACSGAAAELFIAKKCWVLVQMLTACFDGSGKDSPTHDFLVVAGFSSFAGVWDDFDSEWDRVLKSYGVPYFHAKEFAHSAKAFSEGWKGDETRRRAFLSSLFEVIQGCGLRKFGCILRLADFKDVLRRKGGVSELEGWLLIDAYAFAAINAVHDLNSFATREGVAKNVRYVFEKGDPESDRRQAFRGYKFSDPDFAWPRSHKDSKGAVHIPFLGLQAADWLAYEYYLDSNNLLNFEKPIRDRWPMQQFESLPGAVTLRYGGDLMRGTLVPAAEAFARVREATAQLEVIRAESKAL